MSEETQPQYDVVVAGYLGADLTPAFLPAAAGLPLAELLRPGRLTEVGPLEVTAGGVVANTGLPLAHFGSRTVLMGLTGEDALAEALAGLLEGYGARLHLRRTAAAGTAYGLVLAPPGHDRTFLEYPGCNAAFTAADLDYEVIADSRLLHFGYPPLMPALLAEGGAGLEAILSRAGALSVATSLDMTLPDAQGAAGQVDWPALLARVLPGVDVFTPSLEELLYMLAPGEWAELAEAGEGGDPAEAVPAARVEELAKECLELGVAVVLIKAGGRGGYLRTASAARVAAVPQLALAPGSWAEQALWLPPLPVDPTRFVNACGAGDAAVAGFLQALLTGQPPGAAGRLAMQAGRDSLYGVDAVSGLSAWEEMLGGG